MASSLRRRKGKKRRDSVDGESSASSSVRKRDLGDKERASAIQRESVAPVPDRLVVEALADDDPRALEFDAMDFDAVDGPAEDAAGRRGVVRALADDDPRATALDDLDLDDFVAEAAVALTPAQRRNEERRLRREVPSAEHLRLIDLQQTETAIRDLAQRTEQRTKVRDLLQIAARPLDPTVLSTIEMGDILAVGRTVPLLGVSEAEFDAIGRHIRDGIRAANTHFLSSRAYGFLATILERNNIDLSDFALQNVAAAEVARAEYIEAAESPEHGALMFELARILIAQNIVQTNGLNDGLYSVEQEEIDAIYAVVISPNMEALKGIARGAFTDAELNDFEDVFGMTPDEMEAIEIYTHPSTNARMEASFGSAEAGWVILTRAISKLPSTGQLGIEHAGFRVSRYGERTSLNEVQLGTQIIHGNRTMAQGQRHFMSTSSSYSVHTNPRQVAEAGGFFAIRGTSGRFINLFGAFGNLDGGEVLYPPGTLSTYIGVANPGATIPVMELTEADPRDRLDETVLDDFDYTPVDNPILEQERILAESLAAIARAPVGLRRRRGRVLDDA
jgi:hypothetical protein